MRRPMITVMIIFTTTTTVMITTTLMIGRKEVDPFFVGRH